MAKQVALKDTVYAVMHPINAQYAPHLEILRASAIKLFFNPSDAIRRGRLIISRYPEDSVGQDMGDDIDFTERGLAVYRILDLINKTELKSFFINSVEWFEDYPVKATQRLKYIYNVLNSYRPQLTKHAKKELLALGVPEPTIDSVILYLNTDDLVNYVSGACAIILLACLASMGNRKLQKRLK